MNIFLDDQHCRLNLKPFTSTRHTANIRIGILTIKEKWEQLTGAKVILDASETSDKTVTINANIIPSKDNYKEIIKAAKKNTTLVESDHVKSIQFPWQIFQYNDWALRKDFEWVKGKRRSKQISATNKVINKKNIFIEKGATVEFSILNASSGPIYIGKDAVIMEGCMVRGPFSLGENSVLKMGTRIYGATTIGPHCVGGGEIKNAVFFEYSNKAHDGYLGDSVLGAWCNLGAGTSNSNVKNTGGEVKYYLPGQPQGMAAGNKAGLLMGDYSRCAINTSFNTGTVVGTCCNIFGEDIPAKLTGDFIWGKESYDFEKAIKDIRNWKKMKQQDITEEEILLLKKLYQKDK